MRYIERGGIRDRGEIEKEREKMDGGWAGKVRVRKDSGQRERGKKERVKGEKRE